MKNNIFYHIRRWFAQQQPGTAANIALAKRKLESELREAGYSRNEAKRAVWEHFHNA